MHCFLPKNTAKFFKWVLSNIALVPQFFRLLANSIEKSGEIFEHLNSIIPGLKAVLDVLALNIVIFYCLCVLA